MCASKPVRVRAAAQQQHSSSCDDSEFSRSKRSMRPRWEASKGRIRTSKPSSVERRTVKSQARGRRAPEGGPNLPTCLDHRSHVDSLVGGRPRHDNKHSDVGYPAALVNYRRIVGIPIHWLRVCLFQERSDAVGGAVVGGIKQKPETSYAWIEDVREIRVPIAPIQPIESPPLVQRRPMKEK